MQQPFADEAARSACRYLRSQRSIQRVVVVVATTITLSLGCGSQNPTTYPVQGRVIIGDGQVVQQGTVEFRLDAETERTVARGKIATDGSFTLSTFTPGDGALPGKHQVIVQQMIIAEGFAAGHQHGPRVPAKYAEYDKSGLSAEVKATPANAIEIKLK